MDMLYPTTGQSKLDLFQTKRLKSEAQLKRCMNRVGVSDLCCGKTKDSICRSACETLFMTDVAPDLKEVSALKSTCSVTSPVYQCVNNLTGYKEDAVEMSVCCERAKDNKCRNTCNWASKQPASMKEKIEKMLIKDCGYPLPHSSEDFWGCLFQVVLNKGQSEKDINMIKGLDAFKIQCCPRAKSRTCRVWCNQVFSNPSLIDHWNPMYVKCMENPFEYELSTCVGDVLQRCKFGCESKMQFCSNFNDRPLELFRRCDDRADNLAKALFVKWKSGYISYANMRVPIKDVTQCQPEMWKAITCSIAIKPCSEKSNRNQICRSDCVKLLSECIDKSKTKPSKSPKEICETFLPNPDQSNCISASKYIHKGVTAVKNLVTVPCQPNPCRTNQVCMVNHNCGKHSKQDKCQSFVCLPGCSVGSQSHFHIEEGRFAKLLLPEKRGECYRVCQCRPVKGQYRRTHRLSECKEVGCIEERKCRVGTEMHEHKSAFHLGCNFCTCYDGELICTRRRCNLKVSLNKVRPRRNQEPGQEMPCRCYKVFNPVCGFNGVTYPNLCLARCQGLQDNQIKPGDCQSIDPCNPSSCPRNQRCIRRHKVCLSLDLPCQQYICQEVQNTYQKSEDCQSDDKTRLCLRKKLTQNCNKKQPICMGCNDLGINFSSVCGFDGVTYQSSCHAQQEMAPIDFYSPCQSAVSKSDGVSRERCADVKCPSIPDQLGCIKYIPPGGCCPVCGPVLRLLFSSREVRKHITMVTYKPITVRDILEQISQHVTVSECIVKGYLSMEGDIVVMVQTNVVEPDQLQVQICTKEIEKLAGLINTGSPLITTNYHLSIVKKAVIQRSSSPSSSVSLKVNWHMTVQMTVISIPFLCIWIFR